MTIPLRHFVVALGFLFAGALVGTGVVVDAVPAFGTLAHVHLLLVGWVCLTIMGAMTQFVPVWSGVTLHSRFLASLQLVLVVAGLVSFVAGLLTGSLVWLVPGGAVMLAGFWTFVYNVGRTLAPLTAYDVTERHFLLALGFFVALTSLGLVLAVDFTWPLFDGLGVDRFDVVAAHATLAVFGAVLTTIYGALYQLATMFTQTELHGVDEYLRPVEVVGHPVGVALLALGRLGEHALVARIGGALVLGAALAFGAILVRKLLEMQVEWTPMHTRYAVVAVSLPGWALLSISAWTRDPLAATHLFGTPGAVHLFFLGVVGFVVLGTLYHVVPFIVWVHRYSDRLGLEPVPMIDDLYDDRLAAADATLLVSGSALLVATEVIGLAPALQVVGGGLVSLGVVVFAANMLGVLRNHSPHSIGRIVLGTRYPRRFEGDAETPATQE